MKTIGFIGGGRVTRIFLKAFTNAGKNLTGISVYDPNPEVLANLNDLFPGISASSGDLKAAAGADILFLAIHPPVMMDTLNAIRPLLKPSSMIVSLAPKFTIAKIKSVLVNHSDIARINPSASSYINKGINPVCFSANIKSEAKDTILDLLKPLGDMPEVEEPKIEAYAMISAMGHTYFWFQLQKLKEQAIGFGMKPEEAEEVISGMVNGTVETLFHSGLSYPEVIDLVPVKPLAPVEQTITGFYDEYLLPLYSKIKP
jgi:pyrroline-5-carboxylate reductase